MTFEHTIGVTIRLGVATLGGLAVGIEREWSTKEAGRVPRFAGVRTFAFLGLIGGLSAELYSRGLAAAGAAILGAACVLVVVAYGLAARRGDVDATTEVSALIVLAAGVLAGTGRLQVASALFAITALLLIEKSRIHALVHRIQSETLQAAARFAVLALVILPLLPEGPFGPGAGIRPRELWALVLVFSGLSFAGFLALSIVGPQRGYGLAGLLGGLISSTSVTLTFSRESRQQPELGRALALGVVAACTVLLLRVWLLAIALNPSVGVRVIPYLALPFVVGLAAVALSLRTSPPSATEAAMPKNPLRLAAAIQMALVFQAVLYAMQWVSDRFGSPGVLVSAALLGLTDMDALTYSMVKLGQEGAQVATAARALALGVLANTVLKLAVAVGLGRGTFRRAASLGLSALAGATLAALLLP
jgi:uncharacterized membrane protein (DUF4010 family)